MSETKRKVPKLRFPGFTEDWEQRKLGEISEKVLEKNQNMQYEETFTNSAELGIISQTDFFDKEISNKENISGYYVVKENDFIYNPRISNLAPVGPINRNKLNKTGVMSPLYTIFSVKNIDLDFLENFFQSKHWHKYMKLNGDSGARADRIAIKDAVFFEMPILMPKNIREQILIGKTINNFNKYITLHQRKLENLKLKKKALLQKLFPKNGEQFPELRFPGFTDAWEQRKFTYLLDKKDGIRRGPFGSALKKNSFVKESQYTVYEQQNAIYDKFDTRYNITKEKFDELHKFQLVPGDFIMSGAGTIGRISRVPNGIKAGVFNQALIRFKIDETLVDSEYFLEWMRSEGMQKKFTKANPGSAMVNLVPMSEVKEWEVLLPTKDEQYKIGRLLSKISNLITLHQRKLEHLQLQKKALLQQMFV